MCNLVCNLVISIFTYIPPRDHLEGMLYIYIDAVSRVFANDSGVLRFLLVSEIKFFYYVKGSPIYSGNNGKACG